MLRCLMLLSVLLLGACSPQNGGAEIVIDSPWVRETPPGRTVAAGYMNLRNEGGQARALLTAQSPAASRVEIHTMEQTDGMMRMRRIERLELPAGETVSLEPGGMHLMLFDIESAAVGNHVPVTLTFEDGWQIETSFPVRRPDMQGHKH